MKPIVMIALIFFLNTTSRAQKKMDLDDVSIQGELHNDDRLKIIGRERNQLKNYVKYRTDFHAEIIEGLAKPEPQVHYDTDQ